jgi:DNA-binding beta-propeller fold protein YncE
MHLPAAAPLLRDRSIVIVAVALATLGWLRPASTTTAQPPSATPTAGLPPCEAAAASLSTPSRVAQRAATPAASAASLGFQLVADAPLPGSASRFDYQSLDPTTGQLFIAHMGADQIVVFDTKTQQVIGTVDGVKTPTGVLIVPALGRLFVAATGNHDVAVIDARSLRVIAHVSRIGFPDGLAYAPPAQRVFVSDESGGGELVIDATTNTAVTTIDIGGEAGNTQYDIGSGCILVAVQNRDQLVAIDPRTDRLVGRYDLSPACRTPHGFLIDAPRRLAFISCEDNAKLLVVDLTTMRVTGTYPVGDSPDVLAFDPGWQRLYVASESGVITGFDERNGGLQPIGAYQAPHAHSVAVDPRTHRVYLPLENIDGKPVLRILAPSPPSREQ